MTRSRHLPLRVGSCWVGVVVAAVVAVPARAQAPVGNQKPPAAAAKPQSAEFEKLLKAATEARQAERWDEAIQLYGRLVKLKPDYVEGYWYQGTAYYSLDNYPQCREVFRKVVTLAPKNGAGYAFLGLCEFGLKDYDRSLPHLLQSRELGVGDVPDLASVARYHAALLMARMDQHEQALETLGEFAAEGNDNPRVIEALGIATLRMPFLPSEVPPDRREMVLMAGRASYLMATRNTAASEKAFEQLALRYPETPNVHYAFGVFLLQEKGERAIEEFQRELELQPAHPSSLMQIAFEYLEAGGGEDSADFRPTGGGRGAEGISSAQGARPGAARHRRRRRRDSRAARRHQDGARQSRPPLPPRPGLSAGRTSGGRQPGARRVHAPRPAGADPQER